MYKVHQSKSVPSSHLNILSAVPVQCALVYVSAFESQKPTERQDLCLFLNCCQQNILLVKSFILWHVISLSFQIFTVAVDQSIVLFWVSASYSC